MTKKERFALKEVIHKAEAWINDCHCGYKDGKCRWCEQYGCESIDNLIKPLKKLIDKD